MSKQKLFIIEDDPVFSEMLKDFILSKSRWEVFNFSCGEDCLKQIHLGPDVVIIDYNLDCDNNGALNGMETLVEIKKSQPLAHCVFLSGQESYGVALQTISHGAENYIQKDESAFEELGKILDGIPVS
jgi:DNA-binding NarL/FixJ family response regulator